MKESHNPFIRYRRMLDSYGRALSAGWSDADFVSAVERLDGSIREVDGVGFEVTPLVRYPDLAARIVLPTHSLWVKNDTKNVGDSHKARHLFGVMLHELIESQQTGADLAIASCGNAAVAAAVVARAVERNLRVFIPTWADQAVVDRLTELGANIEVSERRAGESGDPAYLRFLEAVEQGARPFSVQGTTTPTAIDGGRTLGWELGEQLGQAHVTGRARVFLQVGGGAMATAVSLGLSEAIESGWVAIEPVYHPVQTAACAPLRRAWDRLHDSEVPEDRSLDGLLANARQHPNRYMWPWADVGTSAATGILDDMTYDWLGVIEPTLRSGGWPVVVEEDLILEAHRLATTLTDIKVSATGSAGLAGLLDDQVRSAVQPNEAVITLFTGIAR